MSIIVKDQNTSCDVQMRCTKAAVFKLLISDV